MSILLQIADKMQTILSPENPDSDDKHGIKYPHI